MKKSGLKNILLKAVVSVLLIVSFVSCTSVQETRSLEELYDEAMLDALYATPDEIRPLVVITPGSDMVSWNEKGDKILMISWNDKPELYEEKSTYKVEDDPIWTFTDKEILSWYDENEKEVESWPIRFKQLIGLPEDSEYTHFTAFWCDSDELLRPAYEPDITKQVKAEDLDGSKLGDLEAWFNKNIEYSYIDSSYPWTRLGYTYDWSGGDDAYGLTEFIILPGSEVEIEWTKSNEEFLSYLDENS